MSQNPPVILIDFDHTLFNWKAIAENFHSYQEAKKFILDQDSLDQYMYEYAYELIEHIKQYAQVKLFTEGEHDYQLAKLKKTSLHTFIPESDWLVYDAYKKNLSLAELSQQYNVAALIDDAPKNIDAATQFSIPTIRVMQGKYLGESGEYQATFQVEQLEQIVDKNIISTVLGPFEHVNTVHCVGIKGVGMTPVAIMLSELGKHVTGSDSAESQITDSVLAEHGITVTDFENTTLSPDTDVVIFSGAYKRNQHPILIKAQQLRIPILNQAQALAYLTKKKSKHVCVCGVGGKTTTSAMMASVFSHLKQGGWFVGVSQFNHHLTSGHIDDSEYFISEADEYAIEPGVCDLPKFHLYHPQVIVVTNLLYDHPDIYPDFETTLKRFGDFINRLPKDGLLLIRPDDLTKIKPYIQTEATIQTYGVVEDAQWQLHPQEKTSYIFQHQKDQRQVDLWVVGAMNALNALAVYATCNYFQLDKQEVAFALSEFKGVKRRLELITELEDILYFDDYGHHPKEIQVTLAALKKNFADRRLIVVFHPHTVTRTKALFEEFITSFSQADHVIIAEIFASAREQENSSLSAKRLVDAMNQHHDSVEFIADFEHIIRRLKQLRRPGDIILTLGAGDIYKIHPELQK